MLTPFVQLVSTGQSGFNLARKAAWSLLTPLECVRVPAKTLRCRYAAFEQRKENLIVSIYVPSHVFPVQVVFSN